MSRYITRSLALLIALTCLSPQSFGAEKHDSQWLEVFSSEFDSPDDLKKWNISTSWDNANNELELYLPSACSVHDGCLFITAEKRDVKEGKKIRHYVSGKLETHKKFSIMYGRFDARFKVPSGKGYWPAFWLLPESEKWPPEIDWMEILGHKTNVIYTTNHYGVHEKGNHPSYGITKKVSPDFASSFHALSGYWDKDKITCYVDGKKIFESRKGIPHEPMYVILNLAVGGDLPGNPDKSTKFPGEFQVDYVRVYKHK